MVKKEKDQEGKMLLASHHGDPRFYVHDEN